MDPTHAPTIEPFQCRRPPLKSPLRPLLKTLSALQDPPPTWEHIESISLLG
jgi:hypothetical protein